MVPGSHTRPQALVSYLEYRDDLLRAAVPGPDPARRLARFTNEMLAALAHDSARAHLPAKTKWALVALGGYGAGMLLPKSDLDLLVLAEARADLVKPFVEAILYPLWDAGLDVGHQVRTRREQSGAIRADLKTLTATLTGRVIAGDVAHGTRVLDSCASEAAKRGGDWLQQLHRRPRPGSPYLLEPDLKDGAGGRRDYDELTWTAALLTGSCLTEPAALVHRGFLDPTEFEELQTAADTIAAARWAVQAGGGSNLMTEEIARDQALPASQVHAALATTHNLLLRVRRRLTGAESAPESPMTAPDVFDTLRLEDGAATLEEAAWAGRLEPLLPGYRDLMTLRRPGLAHTLTVGAHSIAAAAGALTPPGEVAARSAGAIADPRPLLLAALVHDAGKMTPGPGHAERGVATARAAAVRFGIAQAASDVTDLVRLHLVLAETAARADLDDEDAVLRCAREIGRRELVAPLHLLTIADSLATGPGGWSDWHDALLGKLVTRLDAALAPDVDGAGIASHAERVRADAEALVAPDTAEAEFIAAAPLRYLASRTPDRVAHDAALVARLALDRAPGAFELEVAPGPMQGTHALTIATADRPGLFTKLAGVLALTGLDILAAGAVTTGSGLALDTFTVRPATLAQADPGTWARLERSLSAALLDRLALGVRLAERRRHYRHDRTGPLLAEISTDDPYAAVLRIRAHDRVGLLYDVARAIDEAGLLIRSVTATTLDDMAQDTFRLVDAGGEVPGDVGLLGKLKMHLREIG